MRMGTMIIAVAFLFLLTIAGVTFAAGFGGRANSDPDVICTSGGAFKIGPRAPLLYWFPFRMPASNKSVLGLYKSIDTTSCCRPEGENCVPISVYRVDKFGQ